MNRKIIPVSHVQLTSLDLDAFVRQAKALNQRNRERFTSPFPKCPSRWISHYQFQSRPITFTDTGAIEGGLSWLVGTPLDFSFTRDLCAESYGARGGTCYDPASLLFLEVAAKVDGYPDYASFCRDLEQVEKGRCYRDLAGLDEAIPGQDSFSNFRKRVGHAVVNQTMDVMVQSLLDFAGDGPADSPDTLVDTGRIVADVVTGLESTLAGGSVVVREALPVLPGDPAQLARLFQNLICNSLKFRG